MTQRIIENNENFKYVVFDKNNHCFHMYILKQYFPDVTKNIFKILKINENFDYKIKNDLDFSFEYVDSYEISIKIPGSYGDNFLYDNFIYLQIEPIKSSSLIWQIIESLKSYDPPEICEL